MRKTVASGLAVGFILSLLSMAWLFKASSKIVFETDEAKTLGLQFEGLSQVALRPLTKKEIGQRLGIGDEAELASLIGVFAQRIAAGYLPKDWSAQCEALYHKSFCFALDDYFQKVSEIKSAPKSVSHGRHKKFIFDIRRVKELQTQDFNQLVSKLPDWGMAQFKRFGDAAMKIDTCPRALSLALARKIEIHMPEESAWLYLKRLQTHGLQCLEGSQPGAEFNFQRAGLIEYGLGHFLEASVLFERARTATEKREDYRTLYWLSKSYQAIGRAKESAATATELYQRYPLSWHTITLKIENQIDPLEYFLNRPTYPDKYESTDDLQNLRILWLQALLEYESSSFASKKYGEFVVRRLNSQVDSGLLQYMARILDRAGFHRLQIIGLNQVLIAHPEFLSRESLRLLFPKPFYEELDRNSPHLDTALLLGLARQESGFDPAAKSGANAHGLLQLLPSTARGLNRKLKKSELMDYAKNIELGARFMMNLINYFGGSVEKALAAYNAGQGSVRKWSARYSFVQDEQLFMDMVPFRETRDYVPSILRNAYWYHRLFPDMTESLSEVVATSELLKKQLFPKLPFVKTNSSSLNQDALITPQGPPPSENLDGDSDSDESVQD